MSNEPKDFRKQGVIYAPYVVAPLEQVDINGEVVWYRNKWKNFLLKIKHFFFKPKHHKIMSRYAKKPVNPNFYGTVKIEKINQMKLREATILEIDSLANPQPFKGTNVDYIIVKKELKEEFLESEFRVAVLPMLKTGGKVLYAQDFPQLFISMENHLGLRKFIRNILSESLDENSLLNNKFTPHLKKEINKFNTDEELLRGGGISIETLDRLAHGFSEDDIKTLKPESLKIRWKDDLENVKYEIEKSGLTPKEWAEKINLSEPIDVDFWEDKKSGFKRGFYIQDGHHRYMAAKILGKPLNVNLEIKINPIKELAPNMGYDDFHRYVFKLLKNKKLNIPK